LLSWLQSERAREREKREGKRRERGKETKRCQEWTMQKGIKRRGEEEEKVRRGRRKGEASGRRCSVEKKEEEEEEDEKIKRETTFSIETTHRFPSPAVIVIAPTDTEK
jgi:ATPase subunit of ABC transporter with duplicated ATPase domains